MLVYQRVNDKLKVSELKALQTKNMKAISVLAQKYLRFRQEHRVHLWEIMVDTIIFLSPDQF